MAESWVRLWAGTTTDPKWQTIARKSGQPRYLVIALFAHMLMEANEAEERGSVRGMSVEDAASALDCDEEQVTAIIEAMHGRVIDSDGMLSGWVRRQPAREDSGNPETGSKSSTQRSREYRERQRMQRDETQRNAVQRDETQRNAVQRDETQRNAPEADTESEADKNHSSVVAGSADSTGVAHEAAAQPAPTRKGHVCGLLRKAGMADAAPHYLTDEVWDQILAKRTDEEIVEVARAKMAARPGQRTGLKYIAPALLADPEPISANQRASPSSGYMSTNERQKLAAARAIFGTEIEGNQQHGNGRIIDITPTAPRALRG